MYASTIRHPYPSMRIAAFLPFEVRYCLRNETFIRADVVSAALWSRLTVKIEWHIDERSSCIHGRTP